MCTESPDREIDSEERAEVVNVSEVPESEVDVYVGRGRGQKHMLNTEPRTRGWLGNPYRLEEHGTRDEVVVQFAVAFARKMLANDDFEEAVNTLEGQTLGCWCAPKACHGDVIATYLNDGMLAVVDRYDL